MQGGMSGYFPGVKKCNEKGFAGTALDAPWSLEDYLRWQRAQDELDERAREAANTNILARYDPECEAAVRALEEGGWGCQARLGRRR